MNRFERENSSGTNFGTILPKSELMKRIGLLFVAGFMLLSMNAQSEFIDSVQFELAKLYRVDYPVFKKGEKIEYIVHYGFVDAGTATIEVKNEEHQIFGNDALHVVGTGKSKGAFDWFFKVRDTYESYIDKDEVIPYLFHRDVSEGGYEFTQDYAFYHDKNKMATHKNTMVDVPYGVQDMMSAYYFARTLDIDKYNVGDVIVMQAVVDEKLEPLKIRYLGKETIEIRNGEYKCLKFQPLVQKGRVFKDEEDLTVYISDDKNKIPVLVKANVLVGSIKMELANYENLKFPLAKVH